MGEKHLFDLEKFLLSELSCYEDEEVRKFRWYEILPKETQLRIADMRIRSLEHLFKDPGIFGSPTSGTRTRSGSCLLIQSAGTSLRQAVGIRGAQQEGDRMMSVASLEGVTRGSGMLELPYELSKKK